MDWRTPKFEKDWSMATRHKERLNGFEEQPEILEKIPVIDVVKIQFHPPFKGDIMPVGDNLPGAGNTWFH